MADIELVIKIPEEYYNYIKNISDYHCTGDMLIIKNGTPLPKGRVRKFEEIVVEYPPAELCTYPEYRGKPYFSIKYEENGDHIIGFGTYSPEVLSEFLREYFITPTLIEDDKAESEIHCNFTDSEIAKSFIEDVEAVKDLLPRSGSEDVLSKLDRSMECLLESDHRSFTNRETENGWIFDTIIEWRKMIKPYIKE